MASPNTLKMNLSIERVIRLMRKFQASEATYDGKLALENAAKAFEIAAEHMAQEQQLSG